MVGNQVVISTSDILSRIAEGGIVQVIASGRKTSRTTRLIEMAAEFEAAGHTCIIICHTTREVERIAQKAKEMNLYITEPFSFRQVLDGALRGKFNSKILIDNADYFLRLLVSPHELEAIVVETEAVQNA